MHLQIHRESGSTHDAHNSDHTDTGHLRGSVVFMNTFVRVHQYVLAFSSSIMPNNPRNHQMLNKNILALSSIACRRS